MTTPESIRQFRSKVASTSTLPIDSLERISALVNRRREIAGSSSPPLNAKAFSSSPEGASPSSPKAVLQQERAAIAGEESSMRELQEVAEAKARERIDQILVEDGPRVAVLKAKMERVHELERAKAAELKRLQGLQLREVFFAFWKGVDRSCLDGNQSHRQHAAVNEATAALASAYEPSLMPFASDPEEFWKRGITVPPEAEKPILVQSPRFGTMPVSAPTYHDFQAAMLRRYQAHREENGMWMPPKLEACTPSPRKAVVQKKSPIATYVENYPFHLPPE